MEIAKHCQDYWFNNEFENKILNMIANLSCGKNIISQFKKVSFSETFLQDLLDDPTLKLVSMEIPHEKQCSFLRKRVGDPRNSKKYQSFNLKWITNLK